MIFDLLYSLISWAAGEKLTLQDNESFVFAPDSGYASRAIMTGFYQAGWSSLD
jgi:hypothetical protein